MNFWKWLIDLLTTAWTAAKSSVPPVMPAPTVTTTPSGVTVTTPPTMQQKLEALIEHENGAFGPSPTTGGVIHAIDATARAQIARLIIEYAKPEAGLPVSLFAAWIRGESRFDSAAENPNRQKAVPGETPAQAFLHADLGIAQYDGTELAAWPDLAGMTWEQQRDSALDPTWAIPAMAETCVGLIAWAKSVSPLPAGCNGDPYVLATEAYNAGRTGATHPARTDFAYGIGTVARWHQYEGLLGA